MHIRYWLEQEFNEVLETPNHEDFRVGCPFCITDDRGHHLYVSSKKPVAHCFRCGWKGTYLQLIMAHAGADSIAEAIELLRQPSNNAKDFVTIAERLSKNKKKHKVVENTEHMPTWFIRFADTLKLNKLHMNVMEYALKRMSVPTIMHYNIGCCMDPESRAFTRLVIPIERGYYQARTIGRGTPKYINPSIPIEDRLFNYKALEEYPHVFICEGAISAIAIGRNAVATLGNNGATVMQKNRLRLSSVQSFTIAYDAGEETSNAVIALAEYLTSFGKEVTIRKYSVGDPDSSNLYEEEKYSFRYKIVPLLKNIRMMHSI